MNVSIVFVVTIFALGLTLVVSWKAATHPDLATRISPYIGKPSHVDVWTASFERLMSAQVFTHPKTPWGSQRAVQAMLNVAGTQESLITFRHRQLTYIAVAFGCASGWIALRSFVHRPVSVLAGMSLIGLAILVGGWFAVWRLKDRAMKRSNHVNTVLPVFLELMAFTVGAGEPLIAAMERVTQEISGPFADEVRTMTRRIHSGENISDALKFLNKQFASPSLSRAVRTVEMAMERGTPLAEVLRAQASDARATYSRELMVLAGKKETAMLLPVVFFILPMIVAVAIYPGLIALNVL